MVIAVSACLLGENCKYSGGNNYSEKVAEFIKGHEVVAVCPEVLGGLPIPRDPAEIVDGTVRHKDGSSVDAEFRAGAQKALLPEEEMIEDDRAEDPPPNAFNRALSSCTLKCIARSLFWV